MAVTWKKLAYSDHVHNTELVTASEDLSAGNLVNVYNDSGAKCRKADATIEGKEAHGFILAAVTSSDLATVYFGGTNNQMTGLTPGKQWLSTTPGECSTTPPSASGNIVQKIGTATAATSLNFHEGEYYVLV